MPPASSGPRSAGSSACATRRRIEFVADVLPENAHRIEELVSQALHADTELARAREGATYAGDPDPYRKPAEDDDEDDDE